MKTLYISDLDGTLLHQDDRISANSLRIINRLINEGMLFTFATARSFNTALQAANGLELELPVIVHNGVFIIDIKTGEKIVKNSFSPAGISDISGFLFHAGIYPLVYSIIEGAERVSWMSGFLNEGISHYINRRKGDKRLREVYDEKTLFEGDVFYLTCIGDKAGL